MVGYTISEQVQVTVRDLDKTGDVADAAMANGATDANGIWFDVADPAKAMDEARAAAVEAAETSAQAMATAAGVNLGDGGRRSASPRRRSRTRTLERAAGAADAATPTPGPAGDAGRPGDGDGGLRDRLTPRRPSPR